MPSSVSDLFSVVGIARPSGPVKWYDIPNVDWGCLPQADAKGVYVVSLTNDGGVQKLPLSKAAISQEVVIQWLNDRQELFMDSRRPKTGDLIKRLSTFWLPDEVVLYIGQTTRRTIRHRLRQFYRHRLGERSPHSGGQWLKTLDNIGETFVFWAGHSQPKMAEETMLHKFVESVSPTTRQTIADPNLALPFANLELEPGNRKKHGLIGARKPRKRGVKA